MLSLVGPNIPLLFCAIHVISQTESAAGAALPLSRLESDDLLDEKEHVALAEADAAAVTAGTARAEAAEKVHYANEEAGGCGVPQDSNQARQWRAILLKAVLEHGVGAWETQVRVN